MNELNDYVRRKNAMRELFGKSPIVVQDMTQDDVDFLSEELESDLSPENLHCDGEISRAQAQKKLATYNRVIAQIKTLGFRVNC